MAFTTYTLKGGSNTESIHTAPKEIRAIWNFGTANDINRSVSASACTVNNDTTDSIVFFQLNRDVSADGYNADARLLGMKIFYTIDSGNDA